MAILVIGLILFLGVHSVRMVAPAARTALVARLGEGGFKGLYSVLSLFGFVLIIWGFGIASSDPDLIYVPPSGLRHVTEAAMLVALVLAVASGAPPGYIKGFVRHPLLVATILWSGSHLFVNGDSAAVVLFGAFLAWAVADLVAQRWRPRPALAAPPSIRADAVAVVAGVAIYGLFVWRLHLWLFGVSPIV